GYSLRDSLLGLFGLRNRFGLLPGHLDRFCGLGRDRCRGTRDREIVEFEFEAEIVVHRRAGGEVRLGGGRLLEGGRRHVLCFLEDGLVGGRGGRGLRGLGGGDHRPDAREFRGDVAHVVDRGLGRRFDGQGGGRRCRGVGDGGEDL